MRARIWTLKFNPWPAHFCGRFHRPVLRYGHLGVYWRAGALARQFRPIRVVFSGIPEVAAIQKGPRYATPRRIKRAVLGAKTAWHVRGNTLVTGRVNFLLFPQTGELDNKRPREGAIWGRTRERESTCRFVVPATSSASQESRAAACAHLGARSKPAAEIRQAAQQDRSCVERIWPG